MKRQAVTQLEIRIPNAMGQGVGYGWETADGQQSALQSQSTQAVVADYVDDGAQITK